MQKVSYVWQSPWTIVFALTVAMIWSFMHTAPFPLDDHFLYQKFIETLAGGRLDLTIYGFHGSDFLAVPWYWMTHSPIAQIEFQIFCALLLPSLAYLAGRHIYRNTFEAILFTCVISLMPFVSFVGLRGWTGPAFLCLIFLTIIASARQSLLAGVFFGLAILTKPFAIALLPLMLFFAPHDQPFVRKYRDIGIGILLATLYVCIQYLQVGQVLVGSHPGLTQANVWHGPSRVFVNLAHAVQILFSVHNFYFPDPSLTGQGNLMHTTPLLIFLGLFGLSAPRRYYGGSRFSNVLLLGFCIGIGLNALLDRMDHFYMETGILFLILAAIPVLKQHRIWIPLVLATLHFQWFYFFLQFKENFYLDYMFFTLPLVIDIAFVFWCLLHKREVQRVLTQRS